MILYWGVYSVTQPNCQTPPGPNHVSSHHNQENHIQQLQNISLARNTHPIELVHTFKCSRTAAY